MTEPDTGPHDEDGLQPPSALGAAWLVEGTAAAALTAAMAAHGTVGGVVAAAATPAVAALKGKAADEWRRGSEQRQRRLLDEASSAAGVSAEDLLTAVIADPALLLLLSRALSAASGTVLDAKVVALGRALASGVLASDRAALDGQALLVDVLAQVEAPHVRLLDVIAAGTRRRDGDVDGPSEADLGETIVSPAAGGPARRYGGAWISGRGLAHKRIVGCRSGVSLAGRADIVGGPGGA